MIDFLRDIVDYDMIFFTPNSKDEDSVDIRSAKYKDPGNNVGGSDMGHSYEIIVFQMSDDGIKGLDKFEAILSEPRVYISRMINEDWYGLVARKTTTSNNTVQDIFDSWAKL